MDELASLAHRSLDSMFNSDIAAFWSALPRLLHKRGDRDPNLEEKLKSVIDTTCNRMHRFRYKGLAQTSLGIAKTVNQVSRGNRRYREDDPRQILQGLLLSESQHLLLFDSIASSAVRMIKTFDARSLSNLIYSYGLVKHNPNPDIGGKTLFGTFGQAAVKILHTFNPQELSNMLLAFVYVDAKNPRLFQETGGVITKMDLREFTEQELANVLWTFAKSYEADPDLFQSIGNHIVGRSLDDFWPQALSNIVWSYVTAGVSHPELFKKIGDHVAGLGSLNSFTPQALSNIVWAFATAGVLHPELFQKIGDHLAGLDNLYSFNPHELSNTAWAFATARWFDRRLFETLVTEAAVRKDDFDRTQHIANFLWACATVGYTDELLFSDFAPVIASKLDKCTKQDLANIAWAYSVANFPRQELFNQGFIGACESKEKWFSEENLSQLHQWQLWQQELESGIELPQSLQEQCRNAFISTSYSKSILQNDVVRELEAAGFDLAVEVLLGSGYRIDALVEVADGRKVAVEVDGPTHSIQRLPTGSTALKHRQVEGLDGIEVVSVPYWEWDELKTSEMKQHYLHKKLGETV